MAPARDFQIKWSVVSLSASSADSQAKSPTKRHTHCFPPAGHTQKTLPNKT